MFALLTLLTVLIASMFVALVASTLKELENETKALRHPRSAEPVARECLTLEMVPSTATIGAQSAIRSSAAASAE